MVDIVTGVVGLPVTHRVGEKKPSVQKEADRNVKIGETCLSQHTLCWNPVITLLNSIELKKNLIDNIDDLQDATRFFSGVNPSIALRLCDFFDSYLYGNGHLDTLVSTEALLNGSSDIIPTSFFFPLPPYCTGRDNQGGITVLLCSAPLVENSRYELLIN